MYYVEQSNTDSTFYRIKNNVTHFSDSQTAPPYFNSSKFTEEDFTHAYIIGNGERFTIYYYEILYKDSNLPVADSQPLPLNAILISGKLSSDTEGNIVIEDFWYGFETMVYYNENNFDNFTMPNPGDIIVLQCPNVVVHGSFDDIN